MSEKFALVTGASSGIGFSLAKELANGEGAKTVAVSYHYQIANVAGWANSAEMKTAYPGISSSLGANLSDNATLVMTGDRWSYTK